MLLYGRDVNGSEIPCWIVTMIAGSSVWVSTLSPFMRVQLTRNTLFLCF